MADIAEQTKACGCHAIDGPQISFRSLVQVCRETVIEILFVRGQAVPYFVSIKQIFI